MILNIKKLKNYTNEYGTMNSGKVKNKDPSINITNESFEYF